MASTSKPKVAHFVSGGGSGATQAAVDLALGQAGRGNFDALLVLRLKARRPVDRWVKEAEEAGVPVHLVPSGLKILTIFRLKRLFKRENVSVAVCHGNSEHLWGRLAAIWAGVPVIFHWEQNVERYTWLRLRLARWLQGHTTRTICVSEGVRQHLLNLGLQEETLRVLHNIVDVNRYQPAARPWLERQRDPVMVARWARQKDYPNLIRAFGLLREKGHKDLQLHLVGGGKGSQRNRGAALVRALGLSEAVVIHGRREDIPDFLGRHRIFILSTHYEGFALSLLEAMAAGCCVIGTRSPGVDELIRDGENGLLVPAGDSHALAEAMDRLLTDDAAAERMAARGTEGVLRDFTRDKWVSDFEKELFQVLPSRQSR